jgi:hypothetical protein
MLSKKRTTDGKHPHSLHQSRLTQAVAGRSRIKWTQNAALGGGAEVAPRPTFDRAWRELTETERVRVDETGPRPRYYPAKKD